MSEQIFDLGRPWGIDQFIVQGKGEVITFCLEHDIASALIGEDVSKRNGGKWLITRDIIINGQRIKFTEISQFHSAFPDTSNVKTYGVLLDSSHVPMFVSGRGKDEEYEREGWTWMGDKLPPESIPINLAYSKAGIIEINVIYFQGAIFKNENGKIGERVTGWSYDYWQLEDVDKGSFYWVKIANDPDVDEWESKPMPARYCGANKWQFIGVEGESDWPVIWIGEEIKMQVTP